MRRKITRLRVIVNIWAVCIIGMFGGMGITEHYSNAELELVYTEIDAYQLTITSERLTEAIDEIVAYYGDEPWNPVLVGEIRDWQETIVEMQRRLAQ